ncbi:MAG: Rieske (2Fe-2S) protein, partial [Gemmatimonadetes bacterium]|nr:Rieske (2Fe-2S) protein [Gemmatimonadota bacterium]
SQREDEYPVLVVRIDEQTIIAYSSACTHWDCEVELPDADGRVECHCHGSEFDLQGRYVDGPAFGDLVRVPVQVIWPTAVSPSTWGEVKRTTLDPPMSPPEEGG